MQIWSHKTKPKTSERIILTQKSNCSFKLILLSFPKGLHVEKYTEPIY